MTTTQPPLELASEETGRAMVIPKAKLRISENLGLIVVLSLCGFLTFLPVIMLLMLSLKTEQQLAEQMWLPTWPLQWRNFIGAWYALKPFLLNSVIFVLGTVIVSITFSVLSSYALARYDYPGREFLYMAILGLMMIPGVLTLLTRFLVAVRLKLNNTYWGIWLPMAAVAQAFQIIVLRTFIASVPEEFFEAARLDGAGELGMLWHIALPMAKPILTTLIVLQAYGVWNEFIWPVMIMSDPHKYPTVVQILQFIDIHTSRYDPGIEKACYVLTGLPILILFCFTSRAFIRGLTSGAIKM